MDLSKLQAEFVALQNDRSLFNETNLQGRERALDFIRLIAESVQARNPDPGLVALHQQTHGLQHQLEAVNWQLLRRMRSNIQASTSTRSQLRQQFDHFTDYLPHTHHQTHLGYDGLDILISGLFEVEPPPQATNPPSLEMVHYEPTPARAILDLVDHVHFTADDLFYDLGSGLGQVAMLVNLLTGVRAKGVEIDAASCTYAQRCADQLGLTTIEFIHLDARQVDYSDGTVFYLFTPFRGAILQSVLETLASVAQRQPIKICTYGACTLTVAQQPWLRSMNGNANDEFKLAIFESR
ncbi:MAG: hypothetical protein M3Q45_09125 [Chloroflexota bacterium]|nr:hypothetical protein [Chloroflexota bacterium]